jgi:hypothetical protein
MKVRTRVLPTAVRCRGLAVPLFQAHDAPARGDLKTRVVMLRPREEIRIAMTQMREGCCASNAQGLELRGQTAINIIAPVWRGVGVVPKMRPPSQLRLRADGANGRELRSQMRCVDASFPERHKYLARYPADFCHPLKPNLMQSNTVTPMQHNL